MTLEHFGLKGKVSFLNGGLEAWKKAGYPVTDKPAVFKKGNIELKEESALVDKQYVFNALSNADKVYVKDFLGLVKEPRAYLESPVEFLEYMNSF
jgi:3-mercaptopyruvate sulfurtransferase SseA